jgi:hypothetical protein
MFMTDEESLNWKMHPHGYSDLAGTEFGADVDLT